MKRIMIVIALAAALPALFLARTEGRAGGQGGNAEQTLTGIERELSEAMLRGDTSAVERHYADAFVFTTPDGEVMDKAQIIADMKSRDVKFESSELEDMRVKVYGDTAVVTSRTTDRGRVKGVDVSGQYRWMDVFVRRGGRWQLVAAQGTRVAQKRP